MTEPDPSLASSNAAGPMRLAPMRLAPMWLAPMRLALAWARSNGSSRASTTTRTRCSARTPVRTG